MKMKREVVEKAFNKALSENAEKFTYRDVLIVKTDLGWIPEILLKTSESTVKVSKNAHEMWAKRMTAYLLKNIATAVEIDATKNIADIANTPEKTLNDIDEEYIPHLKIFGNLNEIDVLSVWHDKNIIFAGPTGCGKTMAVKAYCKKAGKDFISVECNAEGGLTLKGTTELVVKDGQQITMWKDGPLVTAMKEGDVLILNEINALLPEDALMLNGPLQEKCIDANNEQIVAKSGFRVIGTMNNEYEGTRRLNEALQNRFPIQKVFDYLPANKEAKRLDKIARDLLPTFTCTKTFFKDMVKIAEKLRERGKELNIPIASSRNLTELIDGVVRYTRTVGYPDRDTMKQLVATFLIPIVDEAVIQSLKNTIVDGIINESNYFPSIRSVSRIEIAEAIGKRMTSVNAFNVDDVMIDLKQQHSLKLIDRKTVEKLYNEMVS